LKARSNNKPKVNIITLGCSKNRVDSEVLLHQLKANEFDVAHESNNEDQNEIVIVNTCGFIDNAKEESINTILECVDQKDKGKIEKVYVTGCLSERYKEELAKEMPQVDAWFGTLELPGLLSKLGADYQHELLGERSITTPNHYAYLKISEGCNRTCSFCAIPLMRGKHISKPIEELVNEAKSLVSIGVKEIMLIAQELTYYGLDIYKERALPKLLDALAGVEGLEWIRLHYAYPSKFPIEIIDAIAKHDNICNYLDMPLQHASDPVLKAMKRQITRKDTEDLLKTIRQKLPEIAIRTTMLVGFPGEKESDIEELIDFIQEQQFERLGVFTYSHEEGTSGYLLEDAIEQEEKQDRANRVMEVQAGISYEKNQEKIGKEFKTIIDRVESGNFVGRTEYDSPEVDNEVLIPTKDNFCRVGDFCNVKVLDATEFDLFGTVIKKNE